MSHPSIIHQRDQILYPDILFNRPINPLLRPRILLVGGRPGGLKELSDCYNTMLALGPSPELVIPDTIGQLTASLHPAVELKSLQGGQLDKSQLEQVLKEIHLVVLAPGLAKGSINQLAIEYILNSSQAVMLLTDEALRLAQINPKIFRRQKTIFCLSTEGLVVLANYLRVAVTIRPKRGIFNHFDIICAIQQVVGGIFIVYSQSQIIVVDTPDRIGVVELDQAEIPALRGVFLGLVAVLSADIGQQTSKIFEKSMVAGYLLRQNYQSNDIIFSIKKQIGSDY